MAFSEHKYLQCNFLHFTTKSILFTYSEGFLWENFVMGFKMVDEIQFLKKFHGILQGTMLN